MKDYPGCTWITLEVKTEHEGVDLMCIGYKYNKQRYYVLCYQEVQGQPKQDSRTRPDSRTNMAMCVRDMLCVHKLSQIISNILISSTYTINLVILT